MTSLDTLLVVDYGSQYTQLIARRIRELGVYATIRPWNKVSLDEKVKGIILSGGPASVYDPDAPTLDQRLLQHNVPVLGICYGMQLLVQHYGGIVVQGKKKEYGKQNITLTDHPLFQGLQKNISVWMSHGDYAQSLGQCQSIAESEHGLCAAVAHPLFPHYGLQFHPEVTHTQEGMNMLSHFLAICHVQKNWSMDTYAEQTIADIRHTVGDAKVVALASGGVDSTVALSLCAKAVPMLYALHVDTGLLRKGESEAVVAALQGIGISVDRVHAAQRFYAVLKGITRPEEKRHRIGDLFVDIVEERMAQLGINPTNSFLCQGTLYTDLIESGKGHAAVIKSHHNVNSEKIRAWREQGKLIEPLQELFKDEVRALGRRLGLPESMVMRQPFPGPGLAIRILGEMTSEKVALLQSIDALVVSELDAASVPYWQAFPVLLPVKSVGVKGDGASYEHVVALRAVQSEDGMTADWVKIPYDILERISSRITNEIPGVNRVVYDITSKPPATIEWE